MTLGGGGNKLRKLEFLLGDARAAAADTIITTGGCQSNHARLTAAACAHLGLACELVLKPAVVRDNAEHRHGGNVLLDRLFAATITAIPASADANATMQALAERLRAQGRKPYVIPAGGSNAIGALGYAAAALELVGQQAEYGFALTRLFLANGGSGTHAGLAAGLIAMGGSPGAIRAFAAIGDAPAVQQATAAKTAAALDRLGIDGDLTLADIHVDGGQRGAAYGMPTAAMAEAVNLMARHEGLLLDPVYSGKAFAGLLALIRGDRLRDAGDVVFLMTGGAPTLFGYRDALVAEATTGEPLSRA
ncbi:pyridoxal-phosphate dependent enzyme [Achromobacter insuavis]